MPIETAVEYRIGEEVVLELHGVEVRNDAGRIVPPNVLPDWVIGRIVRREGYRYAVTYRLNGRTFECSVAPSSIEGTA